MRPRVATVLSSQPWEQSFVDAARATGGIRLICRAYDPDDIPNDVDVILAGPETSWLTPACAQTWRAKGIKVIGVHAANDHPGRRLLEAGMVDIIATATDPVEALLATVRAIAHLPSTHDDRPIVTVVSGPPGAPGRTETALGLACSAARHQRVLLIDFDHRSPSLALRLGLPPSPNVDDALDEVRSNGSIPETAIQQFGDLRVLAGSFRDSLANHHVRRDLVWAARGLADHIVIDAGTPDAEDSITNMATRPILVCDASPVGIVRAASIARTWTGAAPKVILNRTGDHIADIIDATRYSLGLEPALLIPYRAAIRAASVRAQPPPQTFVDQLAPLLAIAG